MDWIFEAREFSKKLGESSKIIFLLKFCSSLWLVPSGKHAMRRKMQYTHWISFARLRTSIHYFKCSTFYRTSSSIFHFTRNFPFSCTSRLYVRIICMWVCVRSPICMVLIISFMALHRCFAAAIKINWQGCLLPCKRTKNCEAAGEFADAAAGTHRNNDAMCTLWHEARGGWVGVGWFFVEYVCHTTLSLVIRIT